MTFMQRLDWFLTDMLVTSLVKGWRSWLALIAFLVLQDLGSVLRWIIKFSFGI